MEKQTNIPALRFPEFKGEWEKKKLGEVAEFSKGKGISKADIIDDGKIECIRYGELYTHYGETINTIKSKTNIEAKNLVFSVANDVIIPASGETQIDIATASCVLNSGIALGGDLNIIKSKNNGVWLSYYLNSKRKMDIANLAQGISVVHLYSSQLALLNLNLPTLPEQTKIAQFLTAVDDKIQALKKKKGLLEVYKKGVMQQLFSQELRFKDKDEKEFAEWEVKKLGEVANFRRGSFPQPYGLPEWYDDENGMPFIQVYDVDENMLLKPQTKNKISELGAKQSVFVKSGTLVITIQGSIGRIAKTQYDTYVDRTLLIFQSYKIEINIDYFKFVVFLLFEIEKTKAPGGTIKTITKEVLTEFEIQIPCLAEQTKIANFLSALDEKINHTENQIHQTEQWKKGLLQKMFV